MIPETAFSEDGYLIDQSKTGSVSFGCERSDRCGCGWIALFNLMRALGRPVTCLQARDAMEKHSLFQGRLGTNPLTLRAYLRRQKGILPRIAILSKTRAAQRAALCRCGIVLYIHKHGAHFVAFIKETEHTFRFLNAKYGDPTLVMTMEGFLKRFAALPLAMLYTVS